MIRELISPSVFCFGTFSGVPALFTYLSYLSYRAYRAYHRAYLLGRACSTSFFPP